jgi:hypothetical protein
MLALGFTLQEFSQAALSAEKAVKVNSMCNRLCRIRGHFVDHAGCGAQRRRFGNSQGDRQPMCGSAEADCIARQDFLCRRSGAE